MFRLEVSLDLYLFRINFCFEYSSQNLPPWSEGIKTPDILCQVRGVGWHVPLCWSTFYWCIWSYLTNRRSQTT